MSLSTGRGDDGTTGLLGGSRVRKDHLRIEACGALDECSAHLGLAIAALDGSDSMVERLEAIQSHLLDAGADLASREREGSGRLESGMTDAMDAWLAESEGRTQPLRTFILPGGCEAAARLHVARSVCRRAERRAVSLGENAGTAHVIVYLNRLGDLLFALAREVNSATGVPETTWPLSD